MTPCSVRDYRECDCGPNQCKSAPPAPLDISQTPVFAVSARTQMILTIFACAAIAAVVIFVAAPMGAKADHQLSLYNQEQVALRR